MNLHLPENEELWFGTLFSLGKFVKVIEPKALKKKLCNKSREIFDVEAILTKAIPEAKKRICALNNMGYSTINKKFMMMYDDYYCRKN